jgi:hypothetical protein
VLLNWNDIKKLYLQIISIDYYGNACVVLTIIQSLYLENCLLNSISIGSLFPWNHSDNGFCSPQSFVWLFVYYKRLKLSSNFRIWGLKQSWRSSIIILASLVKVWDISAYLLDLSMKVTISQKPSLILHTFPLDKARFASSQHPLISF